jgi:phosphatidylserine synthase
MSKEKTSELRLVSFLISLCMIVFSLAYFIYTNQIFENFPAKLFIIITAIATMIGLFVSQIKYEETADMLIQTMYTFAGINKEKILKEAEYNNSKNMDIKVKQSWIYYMQYFFVIVVVIFSIFFITMQIFKLT